MTHLTIFYHATKITDAIQCLRNGGHHVSAIMLAYAAIDQMAWLSIPDEKSHGKDFKAWVNKYILSKNNIGCTADELWAARNGLLHMGTAESSAHQSGVTIKKIFYSVGNVLPMEHKKDIIYLKSETLIDAYISGVMSFIAELEYDTSQLSIALDKINRTLTLRGL